jgi:hypothetical protein
MLLQANFLEEKPEVLQLVALVAAEIPMLPFCRLQVETFVAVNRLARMLRRLKREEDLAALDVAVVESGWGSIKDIFAANNRTCSPLHIITPHKLLLMVVSSFLQLRHPCQPSWMKQDSG